MTLTSHNLCKLFIVTFPYYTIPAVGLTLRHHAPPTPVRVFPV